MRLLRFASLISRSIAAASAPTIILLIAIGPFVCCERPTLVSTTALNVVPKFHAHTALVLWLALRLFAQSTAMLLVNFRILPRYRQDYFEQPGIGLRLRFSSVHR
jgi:hypothetical protein